MGAQLSVTVDVDGAAGLPRGGAGYEHRLSCWSERTYGITAGLPRILGVLEAFAAPATFYVPGVTAERHPDEIAALADAPHEVAHHGHTHRFPNTLPADEQRSELIEGSAALVSVVGMAPRGYRAPGWELTRVTLDALRAAGFAWDSSLMGDDRPYTVDGLVELPVHWALDDAPHFAHTTDPAGLLAVWLAELAAAVDEDRHLTVTLHPEILGRAHRVDVLRRLLDAAVTAGVELVTHSAVAAAVATA
ncbi:polysaccharide deacetylase family protein [Solirubrobacter phytolaccae]|uniref:Polysaccharide deacetylase family protein n=1 Tax=Solirubrobacter phytolaccae TaxID=1404360 RepID=A0A9X3NG15_9ACTN|nr:polysaccharide deacetylase family protein [Solirubrobacter phytolaccae]MDA0184372.1 polysaccharide deacetylase family protein [Solirubrobacter phytolaccae]